MSKKVKGKIEIYDTGLTTTTGTQYAFLLFVDMNPSILIWAQTANDKDDPDLVMLKEAFQKAYNLGFEEAIQE
jgi:hypothetical protein